MIIRSRDVVAMREVGHCARASSVPTGCCSDRLRRPECVRARPIVCSCVSACGCATCARCGAKRERGATEQRNRGLLKIEFFLRTTCVC